MLSPGLRIVRGPDWNWENQDGGEGHVGTVCEIGKSTNPISPDKTVVVQWDNGTRTNYRVGYMGKFDLRVIDNAQTGVKHPNIVCDGCKIKGIGGMRYKCAVCHDFDLCYMCYHGDVHDLSHSFTRFDLATSVGVALGCRQGARQCTLYGIFTHAKVVRGFHWEWGNQDGGAGKIGNVLDIRGWDNESSRSVANVHWFSGSTNVYRLGHKGICDLKCVEPSSGGPYYPEHLPILGQTIEVAVPRPTRVGPLPFGVGDKVQVCVTVDQLKVMQQGHGGWNPRMAEYVGKVGIVHRITDKGDIRVQYERCNNRWTYNPLTLNKVNKFAVGDIVTLINDIELVKTLQKGHGEWIDVMKNSLGHLGKVVKVYTDGDLRVQLDGQAWTLNPQCVRLVPGSATELANSMQASQNQRQEPTIQWHPSVHNKANGETNSAVESLVRAAAQGNIETVQRLLDGATRALVDGRSNGKTALQVASYQGHVLVVRLLLRAGASVNISDTDGDTCLHYVAFGNQPEVVDLLINAGADVNATNRCGCTALQVAAHKQPERCARLLLAAGADPNRVDSYGDTALHDAIGNGSVEVIELLCSSPGTDFTLRNKRGFNVLHHAALKGKNVATKILLQHARQLVDVKKDDGFSALHLAALNGHRDVVETLIQIGHADIDLQNNRRQTALLLAVSQGHTDVIELLVRLKANINATDEEEDTALHIVLVKRSQLNGEIDSAQSPAIYSIYQAINVTENRLAIAIACYLLSQGINYERVNNKHQTAFDLLQDNLPLQEMLKTYVPSRHNSDDDTVVADLSSNLDILLLDSNNLTDKNSPVLDATRNTRKCRKSEIETASKNNSSPTRKIRTGIECMVCSEETEENVKLDPCGHKPACEDCSARMKKCLICAEFVQRRTTKDGKLITVKNRQPSAERLRYLENKIAEIEESNACTICMERKRDTIFMCGHGTCHVCADTLKTCHMCRQIITRKIPIY